MSAKTLQMACKMHKIEGLTSFCSCEERADTHELIKQLDVYLHFFVHMLGYLSINPFSFGQNLVHPEKN
ncbi:hypothetical protein BpHYR1_041021 [Brachionus plicatilis]|uniref:Uncharacterized protein n=1 Tax=Brachionus plicatilis TaxID=10195 RepID=A0A3M7R3H1_BRAPC|nr:hypothetical protein BpHYR1_041021 [Brachionus plicatilis]